MKKEIIENKEKSKKWRKMAIVFGFLFLISMTSVVLSDNNTSILNPYEPIGICSLIKGTPAWVQYDTIIGYGFGFPEDNADQNFNDVVNDYLIPNHITFVWDSKCVHCQNQIKEFGESWETYQESGLTKKCNILK